MLKATSQISSNFGCSDDVDSSVKSFFFAQKACGQYIIYLYSKYMNLGS